MTPACPRRYTHTEPRTNTSTLLSPQSLTIPVVHAITSHTYKSCIRAIFNCTKRHLHTHTGKNCPSSRPFHPVYRQKGWGGGDAEGTTRQTGLSFTEFNRKVTNIQWSCVAACVCVCAVISICLRLKSRPGNDPITQSGLPLADEIEIMNAAYLSTFGLITYKLCKCLHILNICV